MNKDKMKEQIVIWLSEVESVAKKEFPNVGEFVYDVNYSLRGLVSGYSIPPHDGENHTLQFNLDVATNNPDTYKDTVVHEFAHMLSLMVFDTHAHDKFWYHVMRKLGVTNPKRCSSYTNIKPARKTRKFKYRCLCVEDNEHVLGLVSHNRHQKTLKNTQHGRYACKACSATLVYLEEIK